MRVRVKNTRDRWCSATKGIQDKRECCVGVWSTDVLARHSRRIGRGDTFAWRQAVVVRKEPGVDEGLMRHDSLSPQRVHPPYRGTFAEETEM